MKDVFRQAAKTIIDAFGDVAEPVSFLSYGSSSYNVSTGLTSIACERALTTMVFSKYDERHVDHENIKPNDVRGITAQVDLPFRPKIDDKVIRVEDYASVEYDVVMLTEDAANATWNVQLRRT